MDSEKILADSLSDSPKKSSQQYISFVKARERNSNLSEVTHSVLFPSTVVRYRDCPLLT